MRITRDWKLESASQIDPLEMGRPDMPQVLSTHCLTPGPFKDFPTALHVHRIPSHYCIG